MAKSTINLLQELSIKQGFIPIYNFMDERIDTVSIQFTCNVRCKQFSANGTGNSKKEAKHNAAKEMLSLLVTNNQISLPVNTSSSSVANTLQSPAKVYEMCPSKQPTDRNYIGVLQEFCQQQKISTNDILYKVVYEEGLAHLKTFTIEVSLGSLRERAAAQCKKIAKQEAARKLLLRLNSNTATQDIVNTNILLEPNKIDICNKEMLENSIRELGVGILECMTNKETLPVAELSEKAKSLYLERTDRKHKEDNQTDPFVIKDSHTLFERNYSSKIPYCTKEKMRIIRDKRTNQTNLMREIRQDIESLLKAKIQQFTVCSDVHTRNHLVCLRLLSYPRITQIGIGETELIAESCATYNLVTTILKFLNI